MEQPKPLRLSTRRLDVIATTFEHVCSELEGPGRLASVLSVDVDPAWPPGEYDREAQEFFRDRLCEGGPSVVGWYTWYAVRRGTAHSSTLLVGAAGFLGPPNEKGEVEIGFSIVPASQGRGYATELVKGLLDWALADACVRKVLAHTTPQNVASRRVLEKSGFQCVGREADSEGLCFELTPRSRPARRSQSL